MIKKNIFLAESSALVKLGLPILLGQLAQMSMSFVDTVVAGRAGAVEMAGVAIGGSFWAPLILLGQGILNCISPLVAQGLGGGYDKSLRHYWRQGFWLALFLTIFLFATISFIAYGFGRYESIEKELALVSTNYINYIRWGIPGLLLFFVCRLYLEGRGMTKPSMIAGFVGLICNIPLNYIFVFGYFGMPKLGGAGCGLATAIICYIMLFVMLYYVVKHYPTTMGIVRPQFKMIKRLFKIGLPNGIALLLEVSSFALISFFIAPLGSLIVAGHQVAMNTSAMVFMIPLSLGIATSIRVGMYLGAGEYKKAIHVRQTGKIMSLITGVILFILIIAFRHEIAGIYSIDEKVIEIASFILLFAGLYQIPDNLQIVYLAALRGYNDTKAIFIISIIAYWCVSLPLGYLLCLTDLIVPRMGVKGFWIGLIAGLSVATVLLVIRIYQLEKLSPEKIKAKLLK